jgi:hypothetical protein
MTSLKSIRLRRLPHREAASLFALKEQVNDPETAPVATAAILEIDKVEANKSPSRPTHRRRSFFMRR